jgi:hypothetical protein
VYPPAVGVAQAEVGRRAGAGASDKPREDPTYPVYVVGVHYWRHKDAVGDRVLRLVPEDSFDRGAHVVGNAVGPDDRDDVRRVLD